MEIPSERELESQIQKNQGIGKILIIISIILIIVGIGFIFQYKSENFVVQMTSNSLNSGMVLLSIGAFMLFIGFTLLSRRQQKQNYELMKDREELRQAQLEALRKGKVEVNLKGKMRKLK